MYFLLDDYRRTNTTLEVTDIFVPPRLTTGNECEYLVVYYGGKYRYSLISVLLVLQKGGVKLSLMILVVRAAKVRKPEKKA